MNKIKKLVICGDSFAYGIGCINLDTQPFGVLVAKEFNWELIRLARGSASNYTIYLQGMFAADLEEPPHLIVLSTTSYDRVEWVKEHMPENFCANRHTLRNLNYHQYPPHQIAQPHHKEPMSFHLQDDMLYSPYILSEQVGGVDDCIKMRKKNPNFKYYDRLCTEPTEKLQMIVDYNVRIFDYNIKKNYDIGMLLQAYTYIKKKGINCIIMINGYDNEYYKFFNEEDIFYQDWGQLSVTFPDTIGSMHTSEEGHADTAIRLIRRIKEMNLV
ncbi:MAG: hypothetical protein ACHQ1D_01805 [Nitrososphaerales archaeon]